GEDVDGLARIRLDLLAQVPDVDVDRARLAVGRVAPDGLEQRLAGVDPSGVQGERVPHLELDVGELRLAGSMASPSATIAPSDCSRRSATSVARRSTARILLRNSRIENGFVM